MSDRSVDFEIMETMLLSSIGRALVRKGVLSSADIAQHIREAADFRKDGSRPEVVSKMNELEEKLIDAVNGWEDATSPKFGV